MIVTTQVNSLQRRTIRLIKYLPPIGGRKGCVMSKRSRLIERFIKYTTFDTRSDPESTTTPSTKGQLELARVVADDLKNAGVKDVMLSEEGYIYGTIESNLQDSKPAKGKVPTIGLLSHLDTANEAPGNNVKARFIENYPGGDILFPANPNVRLTEEIAPNLKKCKGKTIITSDGTTLLGCDDKAGVSILVELVHYLKENPTVQHGKIRIGIIPDEEIGVGTEKLDLKKFGADVAYTLDGTELGEIHVESFNAYMGKIEVEGNAAFPGYGKGIYLNATQVLSKFISKMEDRRWPQNAAGRDPIWWIDKFNGGVAKADATVYLRGFSIDEIEDQKKALNKLKDEVLKEFPKAKINIDVNETYKNYKCELDKDKRIVGYAEEAMKKIGITPIHNFVRGGNDSCHLCFSGLLSTNLFIGMQNMHSLIEWTCAEWVEASFATVVSLLGVWVEYSK